MTRIIFVRHGETEWNKSGKYQGQTDVPLSAKGISQAEQLAKYFPAKEVAAIYASPLKRAFLTAECIGKSFGLEPIAVDNLRELSFGEWEGLTYEEIVSKWPDAMENFLTHPDILKIPGGETFAEVQQRAMLAIEKIVKENQGKTAVVVAHGAVLRTIITAALHMDIKYVWTIRQFNTAVSIINYPDDYPESEDYAVIEQLNNTSHLLMK